MHTHILRKRLGAHFLLAVFSTTLLIGVASSFANTTPAHALDSLGGNATWLAPNVILYTDGHNPAHKILMYQQGKDAKGGDDTTFNGETVAQYLTHNKDNEICDTGDYASANNSYSYPINPGDSKLKSDNNLALWGHVTGITQNPDTLHIDYGSGYARFGGCGDNGGGDAKFTNKRPDGTVPQATIGSVKWTSPYTLAVDSTINAPKQPADQSWDTSGTPPRDSWVESTIAVGREYDQDAKESGGSMSFTSVPPLPSGAPQGCDLTERITIPYMDFLAPPASYKYAQVYIPHVVNSNGSFCESDPLAGWVKISNDRPTPPALDKDITAAWVDDKTLQIAGNINADDGSTILGSGTTFTQSSVNGNDMVLSNKPACGNANDTLDVNPYKLAPYAALAVHGYATNQRCAELVTVNIAITNAYPTGGVDNTGGGNQGNPDNGGNFTDNCPIKGDGDWLFCMIAGVTAGAIDALSGGLQALLYTPVDQIFTGQMQNAFNSFRNVGVALLIIVGLFMVLSQAAGLEIFAAYTIRKALPRLVIAMIGISIAWPILQFIVTLFNDLGVWIMDIIVSTTGVNPVGAPLDSFNVGSGIALATVVGGGLIFSTGIVMSLLGTLLLALLVGFIVLAIRQMIILIAILLAPLAIAASILPSTQKIWNFWRESLLTSLAMFPIIMAFLGAGKAMSTIAGAAAESSPDAGRSFAWKLLSVFCLIAALAALPFAFRIAGGIVGTAHSLVTGSKLGKGAFGRLSEYRSKKAAERWEDTKAGRLMRPGSLFSRVPGVDKASDFISKGASTGALFASGHFDRGRRNAYRTNAEAAHAMEVGGKDTDFAPARGNEDYYLAGLRGYRYKTGRKIRNAAGEEVDEYATTDGTEAGARRYYEAKGYTGAGLRNAVGQTTMMKRKLGQHGFEIAAAMYTPGSGTAFAEGGVEEMDKVIANAARGDRALAAQILNVARQNASQAGRIDLSGAGFAMHLNEIANVMAGGQANGARLMQEAFMSTDAVSLSRARKNGLTLIMDAVTKEMNDLQAKQPMTVAIEGQIQGIETQLKDPTVTGTIRANLQAQLNGIRKNYATQEEQRSLGRLKEGLEKLRSQALMYAAPERNIPIFEAVNGTRSAQDEVNLRVRTAGPQTVDPATGNIAPRPLNQQTAYGAEEQRDPYRRGYDPNDPNNPSSPTTPAPTTPGGP